MHIPGLAQDPNSFAHFLAAVSRLAPAEDRARAAADLARLAGGIDLIVFIKDPEIDAFIMAPGFRSVIPSGGKWKKFLVECVANSQHTAMLPYGNLDNVQSVVGIGSGSDAVLAVVGTESIARADWFRETLPLMSALFKSEQALIIAAASARLAGDAVARSESMAEVLTQSRSHLQEAVLSAEAARVAAVEANRVKSEFLATMSHELRTPLNAIGGYSQLLAMGIHGTVTAQQKDILNRIDRSQRHLLALINDILNLAKLEAGKVDYNFSQVDIGELARDVSPMIEPQVVAKGIQYSVRIPPGICVWADRNKLQQIFLNLLSNAVKFTESGGRIDLAAEIDEDKNIVSVFFIDTGLGIPSDKLRVIFEPFTQVDARHSRIEQGAGLGLAISRDLARAMQGDIDVSSQIGSGSTFVVTFPRHG